MGPLGCGGLMRKLLLTSCLLLHPYVAVASTTLGLDARNQLIEICPEELSRYEALSSEAEIEAFWQHTPTPDGGTDHVNVAGLPMRVVLGVTILDAYALKVVDRTVSEQPEYLDLAVQNSANSGKLVECVVSHPEVLDTGAAQVLLGWLDCLRPFHQAVQAAHKKETLDEGLFNEIADAQLGVDTDCRRLLK